MVTHNVLQKTNNDGVEYHIECSLDTITFLAENIRKTDTGVHAHLEIQFNTKPLAYTVCNIERNGERTSLCNEAYKFLGATPADAESVIPKGRLKEQLNYFCQNVWSSYLEISAPIMVEGTTDTSSVLHALKPHVLEGGGTIMYGKPGRGKSFTAMMMALTVNYSANHYWETSGGKAMYVNLERPERTIPPRVGAVAKALGLNSNSLTVFNGNGGTLVDYKDVLEEHIKTQGIKFLVLDSVSRAGMGDMKEDKVATSIINTMNKLNISWLGIAHTPKYDDRVYYGNSQFEAGADVMLRHSSEVIDDKGSIAVLLEVTKCNDMPKPKPMGLHYSFTEHGLDGVRFATPEETKNLMSAEANLFQTIKELMGEIGAMSATTMADKLNTDRSMIINQLKIMIKSGSVVAVGQEDNERTYGLAHKE